MSEDKRGKLSGGYVCDVKRGIVRGDKTVEERGYRRRTC